MFKSVYPGIVAVLVLAVAAGPAIAADAQARRTLRNVQSYAVSVCLIGQRNPYLKEQGYGWASVISEGRDTNLADLANVRIAVEAEVAKRKMIVIEDEQSPTRSKELPIAYCSEITDLPAVRTSIARAVVQLRQKQR